MRLLNGYEPLTQLELQTIGRSTKMVLLPQWPVQTTKSAHIICLTANMKIAYIIAGSSLTFAVTMLIGLIVAANHIAAL